MPGSFFSNLQMSLFVDSASWLHLGICPICEISRKWLEDFI
jgi:hypothetical protein